MAYIEPIIDRTLEDTVYARLNQSSLDDLKGALNASDLNRIENNTDYVNNLLATLYGMVYSYTKKTDWALTDSFTLTNLDKIRVVITAMLTNLDNVPVHTDLKVGIGALDYIEINNIELNLKGILDFMDVYFPLYPLDTLYPSDTLYPGFIIL